MKPNVIKLSGKPGSGKTTMALIIQEGKLANGEKWAVYDEPPGRPEIKAKFIERFLGLWDKYSGLILCETTDNRVVQYRETYASREDFQYAIEALATVKSKEED